VKALVLIPTYNERENLVPLMKQIFAEGLPLEVLIIDDNSPDGTGGVADELAAADPRVHVMHRAGKMGLGSAYVEGFRYALERD
jgi:dolichol-phosphate mannosyltransferase